MSELFDERFESLRIETPDVELHLRRGGDGPPLLLLHGYPQTHAMWNRVAPALAERFHLVMPDLRGYGDSGKPSPGEDCEAYSKRAMAADCVALMARLGFDRFHVAGHDRGARVTHRLALEGADQGIVDHLVGLEEEVPAYAETRDHLAVCRSLYGCR